MSQTYTYDAEKWLSSLTRALKEYAENGFNRATRDNNGIPIGTDADLGIWEVRMSYPSPAEVIDMVPMERTIIHFEIDDIDPRMLGFGQHIFRDNYDPLTQSVNPQEASEVRVNFDVGVWASDKSGGTSARLEAYEVLTNLFHGSKAIEAIFAATTHGDGGLEIVGYEGGRFVTETINDIPVYRIIAAELTIRVFSRTPLEEEVGPAIEEILQDPNLSIPE